MNAPDLTLERVARTVAHLLFGAAATAVLGIALLRGAQPLQLLVYDALYLPVGPWTATVTATVVGFTVVIAVAASVPTLLAEYVRSRGEHAADVGARLAGTLLVVLVFLVASAFLGVVSFLAAIVGATGFVVVALAELRRRGASAGLATFAGAVPVLVLALLVLGFGLGWGGGYDVVAREVPADSVHQVVSFDEAPTVRDDLLSPDGDGVYARCNERGGRRVCRLPLRGYDHEARAGRFLARHGVRCAYLNAPGSGGAANRSFVAVADGTAYRVTCVTYGD